MPVLVAAMRAVAPNQQAGVNPPNEDTVICLSRAAKRKQTNTQLENLISLEKRRSSRERKANEAAIEGKEKAEKSAAKYQKKVGELIYTVWLVRQQTRSAKHLQSKTESETNGSIVAYKGRHVKEWKSLEVEHKVRQGAICYLF